MNMSFRISELTLGLGLGLGYLTSLRFLGPIGISEILILLSIIAMFLVNWKNLFQFSSSYAGICKGYFLFVLLIQLPVITLSVYLFTNLNSDPLYIISYIIGGILTFLIVESLKNETLSMKNVTTFFFYAFIITNLVSVYFFPAQLDQGIRYKGLAENPNQLLFYASSLSLMLVIYHKKYLIFSLPIIFYIMLQTGSDAYNLTVFVTIVVYFFLNLLRLRNISFVLQFLIYTLFALSVFFSAIILFGDEIYLIWLAADQGNARTSLMLNGINVTLASPMLGWGAGSFSGIFLPFSSSEAHSTPIDLSMQFGLPFTLLIYSVMFLFLFNRLKKKEYLQVAFVSAFIASSFFHFTARHFTFWVEFSIFFYYVFYYKDALFKKESNNNNLQNSSN